MYTWNLKKNTNPGMNFVLYGLLCACMRIGLEVGVHDSNFKRQRYQIQTWAALLGLTNEELLCEKQRNLQHLPFIYTGGPMYLCVSEGVYLCIRRHRGCIVYVCKNVLFFCFFWKK